MKTTALASALCVALLGVAPFTIAHAGTTQPNIPQRTNVPHEPVHLTGSNQPIPRDIPYPGTIKINVDASNVQQRIFEVHETIPVKPGSSIYLLYPKWIPGNHEPSGPIDKFAGLTIHANGKRIAWKRDKYNVYAFHVNVPQGAHDLKVQFQFLAAQNHSEGKIIMTPQMLDLSWNKVTLYPAGYYVSQIKTIPSVTLPKGWKFGSALRVASHQGNTYTFKPIDYMDLVDSPIYAGKYFKRLNLTSKHSPPVHMDIVADASQDLKVQPKALKALKNIVVQMYRLYGDFHFNHYDFLVSASDHLSMKGLEHHRSSEDGVPPKWFSHFSDTRPNDLLTHEFNHSWNGKFRRPYDLWTPNYNVPMGDSLLWVYEGQTQFWGNVLAVRTGLETKTTGFAKLAGVAAIYDRDRPGLRTWRTLEDTTNDPTLAERAPLPYRNYQASEDYYSDGQLLWLAVDGKMRQLSHDKYDLDDFARAFFGMDPGTWDIHVYNFNDIVTALNKIVPYDWKDFINQRLYGHGDAADALKLEGWKLTYTHKPSKAAKAIMAYYKKTYHFGGADLPYGIGLEASTKGQVRDVRWNGPAFKAGLSPDMTITAVNGHTFSPAVLKQAIKDARGNHKPIELLVKDVDEYKTLSVSYHNGLQYPTLVRIKGTPDYLSQLYAPKK